MPLKIAFFGSSLVSAYWNGAATYYRGLIRALHERGHEITFFEPEAYDRQRHRDLADPEYATVVVYPGTSDEFALKAVEQARGSDVIIKASGVGIFDALLEKAVLDLKRPSTTVAFLDVDAPATLDRLRSDPADPFHPLVSRYDIIFTYGGGPPVISAYEAAGAQVCVPIYNALDPSTHFRTGVDPKFTADLGFLGNRMPDRERRVDEFFLNAAAQLPEQTFLLGGNGWQDKPMPTNVRYLGHVFTSDHNAFNSSCLSVLNINRSSMAKYGFSPPTRVFEAAGAHACLISDEWEGIEMFLEPENEVILANGGDEVAERVRELTPEIARKIGDAAYRRVMTEHTYTKRAELLERTLGTLPARVRKTAQAFPAALQPQAANL